MPDRSDTSITIERAQDSGRVPRPDEIGFGTHATDHMVLVEHRRDRGWSPVRIVPYGPLSLEPRALALHYGMTVFEGLKAFRQPDGGIALFRPDANARRMQRSAERMAMPALPVETFVDAASALVELEARWLPKTPEAALYLRPLLAATDPLLGVQSGREHLFVIMASPVVPIGDPGAGLRLLVREDIARTASGGRGDAKTAANYGPTVEPLERARTQGYDNLLWLDAAEHRWIEEAGITNVFVLNGRRVLTPPLTDRILAGITRDSVITMLRDRGLDVVETELDIHALVQDIDEGRASEVFVTGTATVVVPVREIGFRDVVHRPAGNGELARSLRADLIRLQSGRSSDPHGWRHRVVDR